MKVPRQTIEWIVGRLHVATPDAEVEADIRKRMVKSNPPERIKKLCVAYALKVHHNNHKLYDFVTGGIR